MSPLFDFGWASTPGLAHRSVKISDSSSSGLLAAAECAESDETGAEQCEAGRLGYGGYGGLKGNDHLAVAAVNTAGEHLVRQEQRRVDIGAATAAGAALVAAAAAAGPAAAAARAGPAAAAEAAAAPGANSYAEGPTAEY